MTIKNDETICQNFNGITNDELKLILSMINEGAFSGKGVEIVSSLKTKTLDECARRGLEI